MIYSFSKSNTDVYAFFNNLFILIIQIFIDCFICLENLKYTIIDPINININLSLQNNY